MNNQSGAVLLAVLGLVAIFGAITSGLVTFTVGTAALHKEVVGQGVPSYTTNK